MLLYFQSSFSDSYVFMQSLCFSTGSLVVCIGFSLYIKGVLSSAVAVSPLEVVVYYYPFLTVRDIENHLYTINKCTGKTHGHVWSSHVVNSRYSFKSFFQVLFFVIIKMYLPSCASVFTCIILSCGDKKMYPGNNTRLQKGPY